MLELRYRVRSDERGWVWEILTDRDELLVGGVADTLPAARSAAIRRISEELIADTADIRREALSLLWSSLLADRQNCAMGSQTGSGESHSPLSAMQATDCRVGEPDPHGHAAPDRRSDGDVPPRPWPAE